MTSAKDKQLIVMGCGGLNATNPLLDLYILGQTNIKNPNICLLPASDNSELYHHYYKDFGRFPCNTNHLNLFAPHTADLEDFLMNQDVIYVPGGNSKCFLALVKEWGVDKILRKAYDNGTILAGGSCGCVVWFAECITDSFPGSLSVMPCLDILPFSVCPHYLSRQRRKAYKSAVYERRIRSGYAVSEGAALHFLNGTLYRCVRISDSGSCFQVEMVGDKLSHKKLNTIDVMDETNRDKYVWGTPTYEGIR